MLAPTFFITSYRRDSVNQKEVNELRRRFKPERSSISRVFGCYVGANREIISQFSASLGLLSQEEQEMYLGLLKKSLSGVLGRNLLDLSFSTAQVADSDEHRLLQTVRQTALQDSASREALCRRIIDALDMGGVAYLILLAADTYDVPGRGRDNQELADASDTVFRYFVCSVCPIREPSLELKYVGEQGTFHSCSTGYTALAPELGFLYPAFDDRAANIYNVLFYSRSSSVIHRELIDALFRVEPPLSAEEQKNSFGTALGDTLQADCRYEVVQSVHQQLRERLLEHRESRDPAPPAMSLREVGEVLSSSGVPEEKVEAFQSACRKQYGSDPALNSRNLMEGNKFQITTPEVKISVAPEFSHMVQARIIDGRRYILIPADEGVEINGIGICIPNPQTTETQ